MFKKACFEKSAFFVQVGSTTNQTPSLEIKFISLNVKKQQQQTINGDKNMNCSKRTKHRFSNVIMLPLCWCLHVGV